jgi:hypothetical protein
MYCASLFNPTLVISLGVLLLVVGLFYFYVDSKFKEHTNKLNSVASLVTTLVSEINAIKHVNDQHSSSSSGSSASHNFIEISESLNKPSSLIEVSDDEDENGSDDDDDSDDEDDMDDSSSSDDDASSKSSGVSNPPNKVVLNNIPEIPLGNYTSGLVVLKLHESPVQGEDKVKVNTPIEVDLDIDLDLHLESSSLHTAEPTPPVLEINNHTTDQVKNITDDETQFHLELDYKKMPVNKLRSFILDKNIAGDLDISKMKKPELIKLIEQSELIEESE